MKRLVALLLALAGLTALLANCGGEDKTGVLALAFRLDGDPPIVTAYIGDPNEDPFQPLAGHYYIEALDQDDVAVSLGAVDVEEGQVVDFPASFEEAGGVADGDRAQSLKTVATFLIDFELSELIFLEAITGGFTTELPFDPAAEPDAASVQELLGLYAEMADQEEALEAALSEIEERAVVSAGTLYVRSPWAPVPGLTDVAKKKLNDWLNSTFSFFRNATVVRQRKRILEIADKIPEDKRQKVFNKLSFDKRGDAADFDDWLEKVRTDDDFVRTQGSGIYYELDGLDHEAVVDSGNSAINVLAEEGPEAANYAKDKVLEAYKSVPGVGKLIDVTEKALEWEKYAKKLVGSPGATLEESARGQAQKKLEEKIKSYLQERHPSLSGKAIDDLAQYFAKRAVAAVPRLAATPAVPTAKVTPKATPKVTPEVTPSASPAAPTPQVTPEITPSPSPAPDTGWIEGYVQGIASGWLDKGYEGIDVAVAADDLRQCLTDRVVNLRLSQDEAIGECPAWLFEPSLPEETPSPSPEPSPSPSPQPTPSPSPSPSAEERQLRAEGLKEQDYQGPCVVEKNEMWLEFNSGGGTVTGEGLLELRCADNPSCEPNYWWGKWHYQGTYLPDSKTLNGTWTYEYDYTEYVGEECVAVHGSVEVASGNWQAALENGVVRGSHLPGGPIDIELTVQG